MSVSETVKSFSLCSVPNVDGVGEKIIEDIVNVEVKGTKITYKVIIYRMQKRILVISQEGPNNKDALKTNYKFFSVLTYLATDFPLLLEPHWIGDRIPDMALNFMDMDIWVYGGDRLLKSKIEKWRSMIKGLNENKIENVWNLIHAERARDARLTFVKLYWTFLKNIKQHDSSVRVLDVSSHIDYLKQMGFPIDSNFEEILTALLRVRNCTHHEEDIECPFFQYSNVEGAKGMKWCNYSSNNGKWNNEAEKCNEFLFTKAESILGEKEVVIPSATVLAYIRLINRFIILKEWGIWEKDKDSLEKEFRIRFYKDPRPLCYQK